MKFVKKISFVFITLFLCFICYNSVYCAKNVRQLKVGDVIYFDNTGTNWSNVKIYLFNQDGESYVPWGGTEMTKESDNIYSFTVTDQAIEDKNLDSIIFNDNGNSGASQTKDLGFIDTGYAFRCENISDSDNQNGTWYVYDKTELKKVYNEATKYEGEFYTVESFTNLKNQMKIAQDALNGEIIVKEIAVNQFEENYDSIVADLKKAIDSLEVNKELIAEKINEINKLNLDGYTKESIDNLKEVISVANEKYNSSDITVQDVDNQIKSLDEAVKNLKVDKSSLELVISVVNDIIENKGKYIDAESLEELKNVISDANDVLKNDKATVDDVNAAIQSIEEMVDKLKFNQELIIALIDKINSINFDKYTDNSISVLKEALEMAKALLNKDEISIEEFEQVKDKVNDALNGLEEKPVNEVLNNESTDAENSNPKTGTYVFIIIAVLIVAIAIFIITFVLSKKKNKKNKQ